MIAIIGAYLLAAVVVVTAGVVLHGYFERKYPRPQDACKHDWEARSKTSSKGMLQLATSLTNCGNININNEAMCGATDHVLVCRKCGAVKVVRTFGVE